MEEKTVDYVLDKDCEPFHEFQGDVKNLYNHWYFDAVKIDADKTGRVFYLRFVPSFLVAL